VKGKGVSIRDNQSSKMRGFNNFTDSNLLIELALVGKHFTWFNSNGNAMSRLDKVLVSEEWLHKWLMCKQCNARKY